MKEKIDEWDDSTHYEDGTKVLFNGEECIVSESIGVPPKVNKPDKTYNKHLPNRPITNEIYDKFKHLKG